MSTKYEQSVDDGQSWRSFLVNDSLTIYDLAIDSENNYFAVTDSGFVYRSFDKGENWSLIYQLQRHSFFGIESSLNDEIFMYDNKNCTKLYLIT